MHDVLVKPVHPTPGSLVGAAYAKPAYRDAFVVSGTMGVRVEDFATAFFRAQPGWIGRVSMNLGGEKARLAAIGEADYLVGSKVGSWQVHGRSDGEVMFGEHMGFMEYRFSVLRNGDGLIEASTAVHYLKRFAPFYFTIVKPFHRAFVKIALRHAARSLPNGEVGR